jgi:hypothetical protein
MLIAFLPSVMLSFSAQAQVKTPPPCHVLTESQVQQPLTLHEGCYDVHQYLTIKAPVTVEPGVTVYFAEISTFSVDEGGSLNAVGTQEKPIVFRAKGNQVPGFWYGVQFRTNSPRTV